MTYYGNVNVFAAALSYKQGPFSAGVIEANGHCQSNDLAIARELSSGLTGVVDHAIGCAYDLAK